MSSGQQAVLVINTKSRRGHQWFHTVIETLKQTDIDLLETHTLRQSAQVFLETEKAVARGVPLVIVGGGDGTLSAVARYFVGSASVLGVLPLGTGNQFARDLGIEADVRSACRVLTDGKDALVDVGLVADGHFLNVTTVGLTTQIAEEMTVKAKRRLGRFVYLIALVRALLRVRPFCARLTTAEGTDTIETLQVVVGSGRLHGGPFPLAPDARITDGKLDVYALVGTSRWELLRYAIHLPGGHHVDLENVHTFRTSGGRLETTPLERVTVDGEVRLWTPLTFGIAPNALRVRVPQDFEKEQ